MSHTLPFARHSQAVTAPWGVLGRRSLEARALDFPKDNRHRGDRVSFIGQCQPSLLQLCTRLPGLAGDFWIELVRARRVSTYRRAGDFNTHRTKRVRHAPGPGTGVVPLLLSRIQGNARPPKNERSVVRVPPEPAHWPVSRRRGDVRNTLTGIGKDWFVGRQ